MKVESARVLPSSMRGGPGPMELRGLCIISEGLETVTVEGTGLLMLCVTVVGGRPENKREV